MQDESDQGQAPAAVLTCFHELRDLALQLRARTVADEAPGTLQDAPLTESFDLRFHLFDPATETRREPFDVEDRVGVAVEEHEYVPREKGPYVAFDEPYDVGSENPLEIEHLLATTLVCRSAPAMQAMSHAPRASCIGSMSATSLHNGGKSHTFDDKRSLSRTNDTLFRPTE